MARTTFSSFTKNLDVTDLRWMPEDGFSPARLRIELLSGLTVALALVQEEVAIDLVAGEHPQVGLIATVVLMGLLQVFAGVMQWGKFIRRVPHPVMLGFVNGLAIVIFLAQMSQFKAPGTMENTGHGLGGGEWLSGEPLYLMLALVAATMAIIWIMPRITRTIPAPLAGIGIVAAVVIGFGLEVPRVGDLASIQGGLPVLHIPMVPLNWETFEIILPYAVILAAIGLIESLLTLNLVGDMTNQRGGASQECIAQGVANTVTGFFGGMGGCAMIGQSMINVKSGGRTRVAGIAAAIFLLLFILVGAPIIELIPLAALVGVMFMVVIGTFAWNSLRILRKVPFTDAFVILLVTVVTVMEDLAVAVVVGVIVSALAYAWNNARRIYATTRESHTEKGAKVYEINGPLFFGSSDGFMELFDVAGDPDTVIVDFAESRVVDQSALQAIEALAAKYEAAGKTVMLRHLSRDCHRLLQKAGQLMIDSDDDPEYELAVDYSVRTGMLGGH